MKPRFLRLCVAALAVAGFLALSPRASADTIGSISLTYNGGGNGQNGGGPFHWTQTSPPNVGATVYTYCVDTADTVRSGTFTTHTDLTSIRNVTTKAQTDGIVKLYDHYYSSSFMSASYEAAFQAALWNLVYGGSTSNAIAQNLLADKGFDGLGYKNNEHDLANASLLALVSTDQNSFNKMARNQDQIMVVPNPPKGVPAPPAVMLAGIGVLALFGRARWTRRTPAAA